jgi:hypothetical protein
MFIDVMRSKVRPPSGGPCLIERNDADKNMALLTVPVLPLPACYRENTPTECRNPTYSSVALL